MNKEIYGVSLRIQSEWSGGRTRITPNTDTLDAIFPVDFYFEEETPIMELVPCTSGSFE